MVTVEKTQRAPKKVATASKEVKAVNKKVKTATKSKTAEGVAPVKGRPAHHPWAKWFTLDEGKTEKKFTLKASQYKALQSSMCVMLRQKAKASGMKLSVYPQEGGDIKVVCRKA